MTPDQPFLIIFAPETVLHLKVIDRKYHPLIRNRIHEQLSYQPDRSTHNRKLLEVPAPFLAAWELRFGPANRFRVFYQVNHTEKFVLFLAIGIKEGNRLIIGGEEYKP